MHPARSDLQRSYSVLWRKCLKTLRSYYSSDSRTIFLLSFFPDTSTKLSSSLKEYLRKKLMYKDNGIKWKLETLLYYNLTKLNSPNSLKRFKRLLMNHVFLIISRVHSDRNNYFISFSVTRSSWRKWNLKYIGRYIHHVAIKNSAPSNTSLSLRIKLASSSPKCRLVVPRFYTQLYHITSLLPISLFNLSVHEILSFHRYDFIGDLNLIVVAYEPRDSRNNSLFSFSISSLYEYS